MVWTFHFDIDLDIEVLRAALKLARLENLFTRCITPCFQALSLAFLQGISKSISKWKVYTIIGGKTYLLK
jgi:hypothetical protein